MKYDDISIKYINFIFFFCLYDKTSKHIFPLIIFYGFLLVSANLYSYKNQLHHSSCNFLISRDIFPFAFCSNIVFQLTALLSSYIYFSDPKIILTHSKFYNFNVVLCKVEYWCLCRRALHFVYLFMRTRGFTLVVQSIEVFLFFAHPHVFSYTLILAYFALSTIIQMVYIKPNAVNRPIRKAQKSAILSLILSFTVINSFYYINK